jgi:hypothetical protein
MPANGHVQTIQQNPNSAAIVEVNTLSEDDQAINPADHDGKIEKLDFIFFLNFILSFFSRCTIGLFNRS